MESFFRLGEESLNAADTGDRENGRLPEESQRVEFLGPSIKPFSGRLENEHEVFQHPIQSANQESALLNSKGVEAVAALALPAGGAGTGLSRYESQKRRDWNSFGQYLRNHRPPIPLEQCNGAHVIEFLRYLDQFGKTKVHVPTCHYFGVPNPPHPCACPLRQAWGSLDALIGRLRAAFEENGGKASMNPFGVRLIRLYLREVREKQAKARGIAYGKKKKGRISSSAPPTLPVVHSSTSSTVSDHCQFPYEQQHFAQQQVSGSYVHGESVGNAFSLHGHDRSISPASQVYTPEPHAHIPNTNHINCNNAVNPVPRVYLPPFEIHSFMEDIPSRDPTVWGWNPVCS